MARRGLFLDTGILVASVVKDDPHQEAAAAVLRRVGLGEWPRVVTSDFVLAEALNFARVKVRRREVLEAVMGLAFGAEDARPVVTEVARVHAGRFAAAWDAQRKYFDQGLSFTDCTSLVVARELGLGAMATFDRGFDAFLAWSPVRAREPRAVTGQVPGRSPAQGWRRRVLVVGAPIGRPMVITEEAPLDGRQAARHGPDLDSKETLVLGELGRDSDAWVAFQGLRRRLELHQETLSRTLRRLEREGFVEKDTKGYRLTDAGVSALHGTSGPRPTATPVTLVEALLPPHLSPDGVTEQLARRWFRGLRWFSQSEGPGETVLTWLTERGGARVRLHVAGSHVALEVEDPTGAAGRDAYGAARGVLGALAELYGLDTPQSTMGAAYAADLGFAA